MVNNKDNPDNKRRLKRWKLFYYLSVYDSSKSHLLGHLIDLNINGMMLLSRKPIATGIEFNTKINVPAEKDGIDSEDQVLLKAKSMWSRPDTDPNFYNTGFQFIGLNREAKSDIEQLISLMKSQY